MRLKTLLRKNESGFYSWYVLDQHFLLTNTDQPVGLKIKRRSTDEF